MSAQDGEMFRLVDPDQFERFAMGLAAFDAADAEDQPMGLLPGDLPANYCTNCCVPMEAAGTDYNCTYCGLTRHNDVDRSGHETAGSMRLAGADRRRRYNITNDYTKIQYNTTLRFLLHRQHICINNQEAAHVLMSKDILHACAAQYNKVQKLIEDHYDANGNICGSRRFVRRGNIRSEVLAAILYFEAIRAEKGHKKKDIAIFMGLHTHGFARGEDIVRGLVAEGHLELPVYDEPLKGYAERYLEALNMTDERYPSFVVKIVERAGQLHICMASQPASKVVGAIWLIIQRCRLDIGSAAVEKAADNTKKNTFVKFYNGVIARQQQFADIFIAHSIPLR